MDAKYLLKKLQEHDLHYSDQERAAQVMADLLAAQQDGVREDLDWLLRDCADFLSNARSGYIPGSMGDLEWDKQRDGMVERLREAVTPEQGVPK